MTLKFFCFFVFLFPFSVFCSHEFYCNKFLLRQPFSFQNAIDEEKVDIRKLELSGTELKGTEGARAYVFRSGFKLVVKKSNYGNEEDAYTLSHFLKLNIVPRTERVVIDKEMYSSQMFLKMPVFKYITPAGLVRETDNIADISSNPVSVEIIILDALLGNIDRDEKGHNYFILSSGMDDFYKTHKNEPYDYKKHGPINIENPRFIAIDHSLLVSDFDFWIENYQYFDKEVDRRKSLSDILKQNIEKVRILLDQLVENNLDQLGFINKDRTKLIIKNKDKLIELLRIYD